MVRTSYDRDADALRVTLGVGQVSRTERVDNWTSVDVDASGRVLGVEVVHPSRMWPVDEVIERYNIRGANRRMLEVLFPDAHRGGQAHLSSQHSTAGAAQGHPANC